MARKKRKTSSTLWQDKATLFYSWENFAPRQLFVNCLANCQFSGRLFIFAIVYKKECKRGGAFINFGKFVSKIAKNLTFF